MIFSLAQSMKKSGNKVMIYTPDFDDKYFAKDAKGLDIRIAGLKSPLGWGEQTRNILELIWRKIYQEYLGIKIAKRIAVSMDDDFDIVNVHDFAYRTAYFYKKRNPGARIIWTENEPPYGYLPKSNPVFNFLSRAFNGFKELESRKYFRAIDKVVVMNLNNKKWCEDHKLEPRIVHPAINFEYFYATVKDFTKKAEKKSA